MTSPETKSPFTIPIKSLPICSSLHHRLWLHVNRGGRRQGRIKARRGDQPVCHVIHGLRNAPFMYCDNITAGAMEQGDYLVELYLHYLWHCTIKTKVISCVLKLLSVNTVRNIDRESFWLLLSRLARGRLGLWMIAPNKTSRLLLLERERERWAI